MCLTYDHELTQQFRDLTGRVVIYKVAHRGLHGLEAPLRETPIPPLPCDYISDRKYKDIFESDGYINHGIHVFFDYYSAYRYHCCDETIIVGTARWADLVAMEHNEEWEGLTAVFMEVHLDADVFATTEL